VSAMQIRTPFFLNLLGGGSVAFSMLVRSGRQEGVATKQKGAGEGIVWCNLLICAVFIAENSPEKGMSLC
jgi:hypothetical protein